MKPSRCFVRLVLGRAWLGDVSLLVRASPLRNSWERAGTSHYRTEKRLSSLFTVQNSPNKCRRATHLTPETDPEACLLPLLREAGVAKASATSYLAVKTRGYEHLLSGLYHASRTVSSSHRIALSTTPYLCLDDRPAGSLDSTTSGLDYTWTRRQLDITTST